MRSIITPILAAATILAGLAPAMAQAAPADRSPQAKLAKTLAGRTAGKPVNCINLRDVRSTEIIDRTAIVYDAGGGRLYVNYPRGGAQSLDWNDILVTRTNSNQLCSVDIVRLLDRSTRMETGFVSLGKFVPYSRAAKRN